MSTFNLSEVYAKVTREYLQENGLFTPRFEPCNWCRKEVWIEVKPHFMGILCSDECKIKQNTLCPMFVFKKVSY